MNVIQNPELILRLRRALGLVQAHVTPTLNEGVQPVVILGDVSDVGPVPRDRIATFNGFATGALNGNVFIVNPNGSGVDLVMRKLIASGQANGALAWGLSFFAPGATPTDTRFVNLTLLPGTIAAQNAAARGGVVAQGGAFGNASDVTASTFFSTDRQPVQIDLEGWVVPEGVYFQCYGAINVNGMAVTFEWSEETRIEG